MTKTQKIKKARRYARKYGLNPDIFVRQIGQETGWSDDVWNATRKSSKGAAGAGQFIPGTAKAYGVDVTDPDSSLDGAARYMRDNLEKYGSYRKALSVYNSGRPDGYKIYGETKAYVANILKGKNPSYSGGGGSSSSTGTTEIDVAGGTVSGQQDTTIRDLPTSGVELPELRDSTQQAATIAPVVAPDFAAKAPSAAGQALDLSAYSSSTLPAIRDELEAIGAAGAQGLPPAPESPDIEVPGIHATLGGKGGGGKGASLEAGGGWGGSQGIAEQLGGVTGLTPTSTKRAKKMTASGNPSDHWTGSKGSYAIDLGSSNGSTKALERGARRIAKALGIRNYRPGRIYNVNRNGYRIQLIYGAAVDHGDHVHVGVKKL